MRKQFYIVLFNIFLASLSLQKVTAQVSIGKESPRGNSTLLDFNDNSETNGKTGAIILPLVNNSTNAQAGTLMYDVNTKRVVYHSNVHQVNLTEASTQTYQHDANLVETGEGMVISDANTTSISDAPAVLKLESTTHAMILPHVNNVITDIANPEVGMIAYDKSSKSLAIFNGDKWYFWK